MFYSDIFDKWLWYFWDTMVYDFMWWFDNYGFINNWNEIFGLDFWDVSIRFQTLRMNKLAQDDLLDKDQTNSKRLWISYGDLQNFAIITASNIKNPYTNNNYDSPFIELILYLETNRLSHTSYNSPTINPSWGSFIIQEVSFS